MKQVEKQKSCRRRNIVINHFSPHVASDSPKFSPRLLNSTEGPFSSVAYGQSLAIALLTLIYRLNGLLFRPFEPCFFFSPIPTGMILVPTRTYAGRHSHNHVFFVLCMYMCLYVR